MSFFNFLVLAALLWAAYGMWSIYQRDPLNFMRNLTLSVVTLWLSALKLTVHASKAVLVFVLSIIYAISPVDFIPDIIVGLGQLDDIVAIIAGTIYFGKEVLRATAAKRQ